MSSTRAARTVAARVAGTAGVGAVTAAGFVCAPQACDCGRYSVKVLPAPGELARRISPPRSCASSRLIARPSPVPPYLRAVPASACWNASKMMRCFSRGMPMPVSLTENSMIVPLRLSVG